MQPCLAVTPVARGGADELSEDLRNHAQAENPEMFPLEKVGKHFFDHAPNRSGCNTSIVHT